MSKALIPVDFYGETLFATEEGGDVLVAVKPIVSALGLDWSGQHKRLVRDEVLSTTMVVTTMVAQDGRERDVLCLPLGYLNGWLFGISENRVKPALRGKVVAYKRECYRVLWEHFRPEVERAYAAAETLPGAAAADDGVESLGDPDQNERTLTFWLGLVREARLVSGTNAAKEIWRRSPLPQLPDTPGVIEPDDGVHGGVARFVAERLEAAPGVATPAAVIWRAYLNWCREVKIVPATQTYFGRRLPAYGFNKRRSRTVFYNDVRVRP